MGGTIGSLDYTPEERQILARRSQNWSCPVCGPIAELLAPPEKEQNLEQDKEVKEIVEGLQLKGEEMEVQEAKMSSADQLPPPSASSASQDPVSGSSRVGDPHPLPVLLHPHLIPTFVFLLLLLALLLLQLLLIRLLQLLLLSLLQHPRHSLLPELVLNPQPLLQGQGEPGLPKLGPTKRVLDLRCTTSALCWLSLLLLLFFIGGSMLCRLEMTLDLGTEEIVTYYYNILLTCCDSCTGLL